MTLALQLPEAPSSLRLRHDENNTVTKECVTQYNATKDCVTQESVGYTLVPTRIVHLLQPAEGRGDSFRAWMIENGQENSLSSLNRRQHWDLYYESETIQILLLHWGETNVIDRKRGKKMQPMNNAGKRGTGSKRWKKCNR